MQDRFQFLKTYADTLNELAKADMELAKELAWKIIQYGIYDENVASNNPIIEALFVQIKLMLDNWKAISKANTENWKKGWAPTGNKNAVKTWEINTKQPKNNQRTTEKQAKTSKRENIKEENNKIENNNNIILSDNETTKVVYGDSEVNKCLELIKQYNNGLIDWTQKNQRYFAKHLINKLKTFDKVKSWQFTWDATLEVILKVISHDEYYATKITSPEKIYRDLTALVKQTQKNYNKVVSTNVILETL